MQEGSAQPLVVDEGMDVQRVQLRLFQIKLEKALDIALVFGHPQFPFRIGQGFQIALGSQQFAPCFQYHGIVAVAAGVLHGIFVNMINVVAVGRLCRT